mgnify:FL=1
MAKIKITQKRNNSTEITFSGELTIFCAMEIYQEHLQKIKLKPKVIIKLSSVSEIDTAGMQILLILFKEITKQSGEYEVSSINDVIRDYVKLFNLESCFSPSIKNIEPQL